MPTKRPYLAEVELERFKASFKSGKIPLQPFTVIVGRNGSGKSTLIEALQWIDTTIRHDAGVACDRYHGIHDLINQRADLRNFKIGLKWQDWDQAKRPLRYEVEVESGPAISNESLRIQSAPQLGPAQVLIDTEDSERRVFRTGSQRDKPVVLNSSERLAWPVANGTHHAFEFLKNYWANAVFLRLSPSRLTQGSPDRRKSFDPLLDEEGQMLPALLRELSPDQRLDLVDDLTAILPAVSGLEMPRTDSWSHFSLKERMPSKGRLGSSEYEIPAWMLSEGTRRITAILALLHHDPPPSLLCIEEIENGLDPWNILAVLRSLQSAAKRGTQVILTTHSLWLLDECDLDSILGVERVQGETSYQRFADRASIQAFHPSIPPGTRYVSEQL